MHIFELIIHVVQAIPYTSNDGIPIFLVQYVVRNTPYSHPEFFDSDHSPTPIMPDLLAVYRLSIFTNWSEAAFPRQYPQWRPPAQWSKTLGFSHTDKFSLFSLGQVQITSACCPTKTVFLTLPICQPVTEDVKKFVELGDSTGLDARIHNR